MYVTAKKIIDRILALLGMIVLSPVFLILVAAIKLDSRGPVLFRQKPDREGGHPQDAFPYPEIPHHADRHAQGHAHASFGES